MDIREARRTCGRFAVAPWARLPRNAWLCCVWRSPVVQRLPTAAAPLSTTVAESFSVAQFARSDHRNASSTIQPAASLAVASDATLAALCRFSQWYRSCCKTGASMSEWMAWELCSCDGSICYRGTSQQVRTCCFLLVILLSLLTLSRKHCSRICAVFYNSYTSIGALA